VEIFTSENVALVRGLSTEIAARVEKRVLSGVQGGMLHGDIAKQLQADTGLGATRAKLIARDQVGKLYGQVNASRQREMGVTSYRWRTVHDERVRPEHAFKDGQEFKYADGGELPGEAILCRCSAEPNFDHLTEAL
jgi:SPP1 gp7 family putative phage head morphogenesis protein